MTVHQPPIQKVGRRFKILLSAVAASALLAILPGTAGATSLGGGIDKSQSNVSGLGALSGRILLELDASPLAGPNRTLDIVGLDAMVGSSLAVMLNPDLNSPGLGVLRNDGQFLIPALFLRVGGTNTFNLTVVDVLGTLGNSASCGGALCLETAFQIDTIDSGIVDVTLVARVAEPAGLLAMGIGAIGLLLLAPFSRQRSLYRGASR